MSKVTIVTGIWDIKRDGLTEGWNRNFEHYLTNLEKLLKTKDNIIIFIEEKYKSFVEERRSLDNTLIIIRELDWFKSNTIMYNMIQDIRSKPEWYNQSSWLKDSTQATLEMYNPLVMSKMFLLNDAAIMDPFDSTHLVWVDGGITNTVHEGYFWKDNVISKLDTYFNIFSFVCFPYDGKVEIHGFEYKAICEYSNTEVNRVARGGIFGGPKKDIGKINEIYYSLLYDTLSNGLMGTEESLFTIMSYKYSELIQYYNIENNGLVGKFFEDLKNDTLEVKTSSKKTVKGSTNKVGLYVITFNSPKQFETLIQSMLDYDKDFINKPRKILLDNSTDLTTTPEYARLCKEYNFEHIKKDNLGIVGGRIWVAEHFDESDLDFYYWFEDDMFFNKNYYCKNGFKRYVDNLYNNSLDIIKNEKLDFLKLNFTEFFGDNSIQWAWYNLPQDKRKELFPDNYTLPINGLSQNAPTTKFESIKSYNNIPYALGEIYLCNWPIVLSKEGNRKCYLETKWAHPFEQTLMSHNYQELIKGNIKAGLLLLTPTEHDRFDHYPAELRKES